MRPVAWLAGGPRPLTTGGGRGDREIAAGEGDERREAGLGRLTDERRRLALEAIAAEEEARRRIAEDLHDGALQTLLAAKQDLLEASSGRAGVTRALVGVNEGIDGLRRAVGMLHPVTIEHDGLAGALGAIATEAERRGGFQCGLEVGKDAGGPHDQVVVSLARELLSNAVKHSGAGQVWVTVDRDRGRLLLEVVDDGCGFDADERRAAPFDGHIGLACAGRRARALGGELRISSAPGSGTAISVTLPVASGR